MSEVSGSHPFALLPEELWMTIFHYLSDREWIHCSLANSAWDELIATRKTLLLFADVLSILVDRCGPKTQMLTKKDLLALRLVCRSWRDGFFKLYERSLLDEILFLKFSSQFMLKLSHFYACTLPPDGSFVYKSINITTNLDYPALSVLEQHGSETCWLRLFSRFVGPTMFLQKTIRCLNYFHNVRVLEVGGKEISWDEEPGYSEGDRGRLWPRQIHRFLITTPLPELPLLESLMVYVEADYELCGGLHNVIVRRYAGQLKELNIHGEGPIDLAGLPLLTKLSTSIRYIEEWDRLISLNSPLQDLTVGVFIPLTTSQILEIVKRFEKTLCTICIRDDHVKDSRPLKLKFKFEKVKSLTYTLQGNGWVNFVNCFVALEELHLKFKWSSNEPVSDKREKLLPLKTLFIKQNADNEQALYGCNIWTKFPKLKILSITDVREWPYKTFKASRVIYEYQQTIKCSRK